MLIFFQNIIPNFFILCAGVEIQRACVSSVRGSMGCPALNFPGGESTVDAALDFFDGRTLPFFLGQCGASHAKKYREAKHKY